MSNDTRKETGLSSEPDPFNPLVGQTAQGCWLGYGPVLFLEFGELLAVQKLQRHESRQWGLRSDMILWRIEQNGKVLAGSEDDRSTLEAAIDQINGRVFVSGDLCESTGDSILKFTGDLLLRTFVLTSEEDARWTLRCGGADYTRLGPIPVVAPEAEP